jgi:hypothetical protein
MHVWLHTLLHEIVQEMLEMFATTVQAELNATLHVCESGLQDTLILLGLIPKESPCKRIYTFAFSEDISHVTNTTEFPPPSPHSQPICNPPPQFVAVQSVNLPAHRLSPITVYCQQPTAYRRMTATTDSRYTGSVTVRGDRAAVVVESGKCYIL